MAIKGILLDLDNTLYAYQPCNQAGQRAVIKWLSKKLSVSQQKIKRSYNQARQQIHRQLRGQAASHARVLYLQYVIEDLTGRTNVRLTLQAEKIFWQAYFSKMKLRPGIPTLLKFIHAQSLKMVLVTDLTTSLQLSKISRLRINNYFNFIVTSEESGHDKPHPAMIRLALQKMQLRPTEVVFIGDSLEKDQVVAQRCHIPFIQLTRQRDVTTVTKLVKQILMDRHAY